MIHLIKIKIKEKFQHTAARRRLGRRPCLLGSLRCFNTQPPEGGWGNLRIYASYDSCFNTQPPEGGWRLLFSFQLWLSCFNTQPPEGGWRFVKLAPAWFSGFNTQPPEGGWAAPAVIASNLGGFNTQPPEGGWFIGQCRRQFTVKVSTHSRPKAAGNASFRY